MQVTAKSVSRTRLNNPTYLNSPTARAEKAKEIPHVPQPNTQAGRGPAQIPSRPSMMSAAASSAAATANVPGGEGSKTRPPPAVGTADARPQLPPAAQNT